ncbi:MAG: DUF86 domain-containing protein [Chloroflexi bacterium]|nr:DUF86 domain-containing protein [Chloroflexota bacterium]
MDNKTIRTRLAKYFAHSKYPVKFAYLFGSRARGQAFRWSDVDVGVYLDEPNEDKRFDIQKSLVGDLVHTLHTEDVDLVLLNEAPPRFAYNVISGKPIYSRDERMRARKETEILSRYFDEDDASEHYNRYLHKRIQSRANGRRTMQMIDRKSVRERLSFIREMLDELEQFQQMSSKQFLSNRSAQRLADHDLHTCIEAMMDIANHLVAALGLHKPQERRDAFIELAREGILKMDLAERLADSVGMRNVLVHGYLDIDHRKVHKTLRVDLVHVESFARSISTFLKNQGRKSRAKPKKGAKK